MGLAFANPIGFWALLGVPAILAIHALQRRRREVRVSTLFLWERLNLESVTGRTWDRVRSSASLWLQLASVLGLTWILAEPRWVRRESVQRVIVVLDGSYSMQAFWAEGRPALEGRLQRMARAAAHTEWMLLDSDVRAGRLYSGRSWEGLIAALRAFRPRRPGHDPAPAVRRAQALVGRVGTVLFVTDHARDLPGGAEVFAMGAAADNVGFAGLRVEGAGEGSWKAIVTNYGRRRESRAWRVEAEGRPVEGGGAFVLAPGESRQLSGSFPPSREELTVLLDPGDRFPLDDRLPLVRPRPKVLRVSGEGLSKPLAAALWRSLEGLERLPEGSTNAPDLVMAARTPPELPRASAPAVVFLARAGGPVRAGPMLAEPHPLMEDLSWEGFLARSGQAFRPGPADHVLLWQGGTPIVFLHEGPHPQLVLNVAWEESNAARMPSVILLVSRFVERVRQAKRGFEQVNAELAQLLQPAVDPSGPPLSVRSVSGAAEVAAAQAALVRAPSEPGSFSVRQGDTLWVRGAAHFADATEARLSGASWIEPEGRSTRVTLMENSRPDPLAALWLLVVVGLMLADWWVLRFRTA